jgi:hypothetical protein
MEEPSTENEKDVNNISNEPSKNSLNDNKEKNENYEIIKEKLNTIINNIKTNYDFQIDEKEKINNIVQVIN